MTLVRKCTCPSFISSPTKLSLHSLIDLSAEKALWMIHSIMSIQSGFSSMSSSPAKSLQNAGLTQNINASLESISACDFCCNLQYYLSLLPSLTKSGYNRVTNQLFLSLTYNSPPLGWAFDQIQLLYHKKTTLKYFISWIIIVAPLSPPPPIVGNCSTIMRPWNMCND